MDKWILIAMPENHGSFSDGFYYGSSYFYKGAKHAVVDKDIKKAKSYSTYSKAIAACNKLCFENYRFEVARKSDFK